MDGKRNTVLLAVGGAAALLLLAVVVLVLLVDLKARKSRLEATASDLLGMEVRIGGKMGVGFIPGFHVSLGDVRIRNRGADVASAKEAILRLELLPLFRDEIRIVKIGITAPRISIEQDRDGKFNFEAEEGEEAKKAAGDAGAARVSLDATNITLKDGTLFYADRKTGDAVEAGNFDLAVSRIHLPEAGAGTS